MYVMPKNWKIWIAIKIIRIITTKFSLSQLLKLWLGMRTHSEFLLSFFLKLNSFIFSFSDQRKARQMIQNATLPKEGKIQTMLPWSKMIMEMYRQVLKDGNGDIGDAWCVLRCHFKLFSYHPCFFHGPLIQRLMEIIAGIIQEIWWTCYILNSDT